MNLKNIIKPDFWVRLFTPKSKSETYILGVKRSLLSTEILGKKIIEASIWQTSIKMLSEDDHLELARVLGIENEITLTLWIGPCGWDKGDKIITLVKNRAQGIKDILSYPTCMWVERYVYPKKYKRIEQARVHRTWIVWLQCSCGQVHLTAG